MNFNIVQIDDYRIVVLDTTRGSSSNLPIKIYSMELTIQGNVMPDNKVKLDALNYMFNERTDNELYTITSSVLGFGSGIKIPDGVYTCNLNINNTENVNLDFIVVSGIKDKLIAISENIQVDLVIEDRFVRGSELTDSMLHYYYAMSLYSKLILSTGELVNYKESEKIINQLKRVLSIIDKVNFKI